MIERLKQSLKEIARKPVEAVLKVYLSAATPEHFSPDEVRRILVFAYHGLGNFIMYTPALKLLRERYPLARIDLQVGNNTGCEDVLAGAGLFDNIYNTPYRAGIVEWLKRALEIRRTGYDLTINEFHSHSWKLALLVAASRARYRAGHVTSPGWSKRFSRFSFIFNLPVEMREDEHEIERYIDLIAAVGAERVGLFEAKTFMHLTEEDRAFARDFLEQGRPRVLNPVIGVQPGTSLSMRWKQWPLDRYRALIEQITADRPDAIVVLFGSPGEKEMIDDLKKGLGPAVRVAAGKTSVKQVAALIERCDMLICNDSGLMHAAVAVGTPVIAIYGPTDIRRTAPLGDRHTVIRRDLQCSPCFKLEGEQQVHCCPHHDCLMTIPAQEVFEIVKSRSSKSVLMALACIIALAPWMAGCKTSGKAAEQKPAMAQCIDELNDIPVMAAVLKSRNREREMPARPLEGMEIALTINGMVRSQGEPEKGEDNWCEAENSPENFEKLVAALKQNDMPPVVAFVAGHQLDMALAETWSKSGNILGNMTYSRKKARKRPAQDFIEDIARNDRLLAEYGSARGRHNYFRFPYLKPNRDPQTREQVRAYLKKHNYLEVSATIDCQDNRFSQLSCAAAARGDQTCVNLIKAHFKSLLLDKTLKARRAAKKMADREVKHILVIGATQFTCDNLAEMIAWYRSMGARFITLEEAMRDPFHTTVDEKGRLAGRTIIGKVKRQQLSQTQPD
ncbi:MAG TPA: lipopolysaccharide heptosyltransferase II [Blastocatellia bacterium]|nr:lipopolysaccharide heptosyltransferase II [Blastocatellia bacterium]